MRWWRRSSVFFSEGLLFLSAEQGFRTVCILKRAPLGHVFQWFAMNTPEDRVGYDLLHQHWQAHERVCEQYASVCYQPICFLALFGGMRAWVGWYEGSVSEGLWACALACFLWLGSRGSVMGALNYVSAGYLCPAQLRYEAWLLLWVWQKRGYPWHQVVGASGPLASRMAKELEAIRLGKQSYDAQAASAHLACMGEAYQRQRRWWLWGTALVAYVLLIWIGSRWILWVMRPLWEGEEAWSSSMMP